MLSSIIFDFLGHHRSRFLQDEGEGLGTGKTNQPVGWLPNRVKSSAHYGLYFLLLRIFRMNAQRFKEERPTTVQARLSRAP